jgi:hypothetical protein
MRRRFSAEDVVCTFLSLSIHDGKVFIASLSGPQNKKGDAEAPPSLHGSLSD